MGWGGGEGVHPPMCTCTCMHHREFPGIPQWGWPFAWNYHVYHTCMCVHACVCMCVHVHLCGGHPPPPPPPSTITLEWIKIIKFCLKICDPLTLLHTYRLGLMCRWGVSYHKWHFYVFDPKKCSRDPPIKKFPIFALNSIRPYLDWTLRGFLTSLPIYNPFKFELKWRPKCKIELKCQFAIELSATKKFEMYS